MAELINGKIVSEKLRYELKEEIFDFAKKSGHTPGLAVVLVGDDPASQVYVRNKHKACLEVGINSYEISLPSDTDDDSLIALIDELNNDSKVDGILVQLPLPRHIDEKRVINRIDPNKDVDAFSPANVGKIIIGNYSFLPCTPAGVMELLKHYNISIEGKNCVVVGRSNIVGKPMAMLLLEKNGTVTVCHSKTRNIGEICRSADIIVVAVGRAGFLTADMVKPGAVVIDVGINRNSDGKLFGDVDFDEVAKIASFITPVPGGVGPMTITMLLKNTLSAAKIQNGKNN
jgi:methylenetetrahydrofolate dehydrogenase (NADP+)/methenyltetrahydrofolate cyclohydrolase